MGRLLLVVLAVVLLMGASAPPVAAQLPGLQIALEVTPHASPITPITETAEIGYTLSAACETGTARADPGPVKIQMSVDAPDAWAVVTVSPADHYINTTSEECLTGKSIEHEGKVAIAPTEDAPAGVVFPITLTATPSEGEAVSYSWNETAGAYLNVQARFAKSIWQAHPSTEVRLPLIIENFGNGVLRATFGLTEETSQVLNITLPEPVEVKAGETAEATVVVQTAEANGYINRQDGVVLAVHLTSVDDTSLTEEKQLSAVIQTQGTDVVEGPGPAVMFLLLVALLGLLGFRRD